MSQRKTPTSELHDATRRQLIAGGTLAGASLVLPGAIR